MNVYDYLKRDPRFRINPSKEFYIVYQPKEPIKGRHRRFILSFHSLVKYVGQNNAFSALLRALDARGYKCRVKLRKYGIIDFYSK